jgi:hypothetical protein
MEEGTRVRMLENFFVATAFTLIIVGWEPKCAFSVTDFVEEAREENIFCSFISGKSRKLLTEIL